MVILLLKILQFKGENLMKQKHFYYIIVQSEGQAKFVTAINNSTKTARWETNGKPLALSKYYAEDVAFCLNLNYYPAFVVQSLYEIPEQIFYTKPNKEKTYQ